MSGILFEPVRAGSLTLKNRILMSAAAAYEATDEGDIDWRGPIVHFEVARGGCALVPTGGVSGIHPSGRTNGTRPMFDSDQRIPSFKIFADRVRSGGAAPFLQITHGGAGAAPYQLSLGRKPFVASSYLKDPKGGFGEDNRSYDPAAEEEIFQVVSAYGEAAARARRAGFAGVQVHAAHDSLLSQWLSPLYNSREDSWGGSVENRCRIHREILRDIKRKAGRDFPVSIKLGIEDAFPGGAKEDEGVRAAELIAGEGNADIIEVSQGLQDMTDLNRTSMKIEITSIEREAYYRPWTKRVKAAVGDRVLVTIQGGLRSPSLMAEIVENGEADLVSMCRPYIREPRLVDRWRDGDLSPAACISCNRCALGHAVYHRPLACVFNRD